MTWSTTREPEPESESAVANAIDFRQHYLAYKLNIVIEVSGGEMDGFSKPPSTRTSA